MVGAKLTADEDTLGAVIAVVLEGGKWLDETENRKTAATTIWALAQYQRLGLIKTAPDYKALADKLVLRSVYEKAAKAAGVAVPADDMKPLVSQLDNTTFDPTKPAAEASRP